MLLTRRTIFRFIATYDDKTLERISPTLQPGECEHVPVVQDECIFHPNESRWHAWLLHDQQPIKKKGNGRLSRPVPLAAVVLGFLSS